MAKDLNWKNADLCDMDSERRHYGDSLQSVFFNNDIESCILEFVCGNLDHGADELKNETFCQMRKTDVESYKITMCDKKTAMADTKVLEQALKSGQFEIYSLWHYDVINIECDCNVLVKPYTKQQKYRTHFAGQLKLSQSNDPKYAYFLMATDEHIIYEWIGGIASRWEAKSKYFINVHLSTSINDILSQIKWLTKPTD